MGIEAAGQANNEGNQHGGLADMNHLGVPLGKASGSHFPLQVLARFTALWAFRSNRSRECPRR